jgi:hypothetical protein
MGTISDEEPVCEIHKDDNDDVFILIDGMKIAKRGLPDTAHAMTWIMLEPGWIVRDVDHGNAIEVWFEGAQIHWHAKCRIVASPWRAARQCLQMSIPRLTAAAGRP